MQHKSQVRWSAKQKCRQGAKGECSQEAGSKRSGWFEKITWAQRDLHSEVSAHGERAQSQGYDRNRLNFCQLSEKHLATGQDCEKAPPQACCVHTAQTRAINLSLTARPGLGSLGAYSCTDAHVPGRGCRHPQTPPTSHPSERKAPPVSEWGQVARCIAQRATLELMITSTRRFCWRPASVALLATG